MKIVRYTFRLPCCQLNTAARPIAATPCDGLLARHLLSLLDGRHRLVEGVHLHALLAQGAWRAEQVGAEVAETRPGDLAGRSHLAAYAAHAEETDAGTEEQHAAVQQAALADLLGHLAGRVARHEVGDDAQAAVVEAAEQAVLKFARHSSCNLDGRRRMIKQNLHGATADRRLQDWKADDEQRPSLTGLL